MSASLALAPFVSALNLDKLRVGPPKRFIFFCGGPLSERATPPFFSLRAYLSRELDEKKKINNTNFVYAEGATKFFKDSKYKDLISFEADVAQISELVLLIAESPGSLTELGAFSMHPEIAPRLQLFVRDDYFGKESFIYDGPLSRMENEYPESVLYYPWRLYKKDGRLRIKSISRDIPRIISDINKRLNKSPKTELFKASNARHQMMAIFWCVFKLGGASLVEITESIGLFGINLSSHEVQKYLYCMHVANWIAEKKYSNTVYYYNRISEDPFDYAFVHDAAAKDHLRLTIDVKEALKKKDLRRPQPILDAIGT